MTSDDPSTLDRDVPGTARARLGKLGELSTIRHSVPGSINMLALAFAAALAIVICAALALGTPAADLLDVYIGRLRDVK